jgi:hypothetical protein
VDHPERRARVGRAPAGRRDGRHGLPAAVHRGASCRRRRGALRRSC